MKIVLTWLMLVMIFLSVPTSVSAADIDHATETVVSDVQQHKNKSPLPKNINRFRKFTGNKNDGTFNNKFIVFPKVDKEVIKEKLANKSDEDKTPSRNLRACSDGETKLAFANEKMRFDVYETKQEASVDGKVKPMFFKRMNGGLPQPKPEKEGFKK